MGQKVLRLSLGLVFMGTPWLYAGEQADSRQLKLKLEGPSKKVVGETATYTVSLINSGTGPAASVRLLAIFDEGLEHASRANPLEFAVGALARGEKKPVTLELTPKQAGRLTTFVMVTADGGLTAWGKHVLMAQEAGAADRDQQRTADRPYTNDQETGSLRKLLAQNKDLIPSLIEALKDTEADVRLGAAHALASLGKEAVPSLMETLSHKDKNLRAFAIYALGQAGKPAGPAIPLLIKAIKDEDKEVRRQAVGALQKIIADSSAQYPDSLAPRSYWPATGPIPGTEPRRQP